MLYVVRHATAGDRRGWSGGDLERPLDETGHTVASELAAALAEMPIGRVLSSRATRCQQTVAPLAAAVGVAVEVAQSLAEGSKPVDTLELFRDLVDTDTHAVLCSHGDVIPETLGLLLHEGMAVSGRSGCEKGSIWVLETKGRDIVRGRYHPDPISLRQPPAAS